MAINWKTIISSIFTRLEEELPFLIISFLCIGGDDLLRELSNFGFEWLCKASLIFLFAFLLTLSISIIKSRLYKLFLYIFLIFLAGIDVFLGMNFSTGISPQIFLLLAETNTQESKEFLEEFIFSPGSYHMLRIMIIYTLTVLISEYLYSKRSFFNHKIIHISHSIFKIVTCCLLILSIYSCKTYVDLFKVKLSDQLSNWYNYSDIKAHDKFSKILYSAYSVILSRNEVHQAIKQTEVAAQEKPTRIMNDSLNIIVVIGESYIKSHSQLYGYHLETCPNLLIEQDKGNLFVFNDVISPYNGTSASIKNMLSCNSLSDNEYWYNKPIFPTIFKNSGYRVSMWDNQKQDVSFAVVSMTLQSFLYNNKVESYSYNFTNNDVKDHDLDFINYMSDYPVSGKNNLVIIHLMGQHLDAKKRFPDLAQYHFFSKDDILRHEEYLTDEKKQEIADYDNATRYNDLVLKQIIDLYRYKNTVLLYLSDHGEEIYDYRNHKGRDLSSSHITYHYLKSQHEIPFMIWCSDTYKSKNPIMVKSIKSAIDKPFMSDNLPQLLFHLGGINTIYYKPKKDILNNEYECGKRIVHDTDYDLLRRHN